jgi:hypothetical protein
MRSLLRPSTVPEEWKEPIQERLLLRKVLIRGSIELGLALTLINLPDNPQHAQHVPHLRSLVYSSAFCRQEASRLRSNASGGGARV